MNTSESSQASLSLTGAAEGITDSPKPNARYEASISLIAQFKLLLYKQESPNFSQWIRKISHIYIPQLFTTSLLRALAFIHTAGIIHLDVKPENVMFARWDAKLKLPWSGTIQLSAMWCLPGGMQSKNYLKVSQIKFSATSPRSWSWLTLDLLDDCHRMVGHQLSQLGRYI